MMILEKPQTLKQTSQITVIIPHNDNSNTTKDEWKRKAETNSKNSNYELPDRLPTPAARPPVSRAQKTATEILTSTHHPNVMSSRSDSPSTSITEVPTPDPHPAKLHAD
jgi:hypothetical protein